MYSDTGGPKAGRRERPESAHAAIWFAVALLVLSWHWSGGDWSAVFPGNPWNTFGYLNSAAVYAKETYGRVVAATEAD